MHYYDIQPVIRRSAKLGAATYASSNVLQASQVVRIPYGPKQTAGIVMAEAVKPKFKTKLVEGIVSEQPLPDDLINLAQTMLTRNLFDTSTVYSLLVPNGAHKNRRGEPKSVLRGHSNPQPQLSTSQTNILKQFTQKSGYKSWLLHGITGAGKTRVYFEQAKTTLERGRDVIILVPEIALSKQLFEQAQQFFGAPIFRTNSEMTESESHKTWKSILEQNDACVVIGPRSALFSPTRDVGLIVIDECHDQSFKQDQLPQYNALHIAAQRARLNGAQLIMGSATPNVTEFWLAQHHNLSLASLPNTIFKQHSHERHIIDNRKRDLFTRNQHLSNPLLDAIHQALTDRKQTLLYVNRRGHSPVVKCSDCDWRALCNLCTLPLVYHSAATQLRCHVCNIKSNAVTECPECKSVAIRYRGVGTQKLETEVNKLFPTARISRLDRDTSDKTTTKTILNKMKTGETDILVGTQMITKGFDFQRLAVVGIVNADSMLYLPDFRSSERAFQVIFQAIGRNDRLGSGGATFVQTASPNHHAVLQAVAHNYEGFYRQEIHDRHASGFPPFSYILKITARRKSPLSAQKVLNTIVNQTPRSVRVLGPAPAMHTIQGSNHVWHLVLLANSRSSLLKFGKELAGKKVTLDLDPLDLL